MSRLISLSSTTRMRPARGAGAAAAAPAAGWSRRSGGPSTASPRRRPRPRPRDRRTMSSMSASSLWPAPWMRRRSATSGGGARLLRVLDQHLGVADDGVHRRAQVVADARARGLQVRPRGPRRAGSRISLMRASRLRPAASILRRSSRGGARGLVLDQHLAVAEDRVHGRAQLVAHVGEERAARPVRPGCAAAIAAPAHAGGLAPSSASILPSSRGSSMGLVS